MSEIDCTHPSEQRWQYVHTWLCCKCNRYFWGKKEFTPTADIYGRYATGVAARAAEGGEDE